MFLKNFCPKLCENRCHFVRAVFSLFNFTTRHIAMTSASQYDSCRHSNMVQTRPIFFHVDSLTSFC